GGDVWVDVDAVAGQECASVLVGDGPFLVVATLPTEPCDLLPRRCCVFQRSCDDGPGPGPVDVGQFGVASGFAVTPLGVAGGVGQGAYRVLGRGVGGHRPTQGLATFTDQSQHFGHTLCSQVGGDNGFVGPHRAGPQDACDVVGNGMQGRDEHDHDRVD